MTDPAGKRGPGSVNRPAGSIGSPVGRFAPELSRPSVFGKPFGGTERHYLVAGRTNCEPRLPGLALQQLITEPFAARRVHERVAIGHRPRKISPLCSRGLAPFRPGAQGDAAICA
jgi:hypothetical protein